MSRYEKANEGKGGEHPQAEFPELLVTQYKTLPASLCDTLLEDLTDSSVVKNMLPHSANHIKGNAWVML